MKMQQQVQGGGIHGAAVHQPEAATRILQMLSSIVARRQLEWQVAGAAERQSDGCERAGERHPLCGVRGVRRVRAHIGGSSVLSRPPVRFAPLQPNALGRRGILRFYKFFFVFCIVRSLAVLCTHPTAAYCAGAVCELLHACMPCTCTKEGLHALHAHAPIPIP
eukprot:scaffold10571_cov152-Isochrysis_galbana.AAC.2